MLGHPCVFCTDMFLSVICNTDSSLQCLSLSTTEHFLNPVLYSVGSLALWNATVTWPHELSHLMHMDICVVAAELYAWIKPMEQQWVLSWIRVVQVKAPPSLTCHSGRTPQQINCFWMWEMLDASLNTVKFRTLSIKKIFIGSSTLLIFPLHLWVKIPAIKNGFVTTLPLS